MIKYTVLFIFCQIFLTNALIAAATTVVTVAPANLSSNTDSTSTPTEPSNLYSGLNQWQMDILESHNTERALHGLQPLNWSTQYAESAQAWADRCQWAHSSGPYGENLWASMPPAQFIDGNRPADSWLAEKFDWNCETNTCNPNKVCGHYTQMVWDTTEEVGCAIHRGCPQTSPLPMDFDFVVCQYYPPGNYIGKRPFPATECYPN